MGAEFREFLLLFIEHGEDARNRGVQIGDAELMGAGVDAMRLHAGDARELGNVEAGIRRG